MAAPDVRLVRHRTVENVAGPVVAGLLRLWWDVVHPDSRRAPQVVVMGVSATGKSTVGRQVAALLDSHLVEGDDFHPPENIKKMSSGTPLTDEDRSPWLQTLAALLEQRRAAEEPTVLTCSALRRKYRDILRGTGTEDDTLFLHLHADFEVLRARMASRSHFMPASLLQSQFDTLEELGPDERGIKLDVAAPLEQVIGEVRDFLLRNGVQLPADGAAGPDPAKVR
jgi:gluconokinase